MVAALVVLAVLHGDPSYFGVGVWSLRRGEPLSSISWASSRLIAPVRRRRWVQISFWSLWEASWKLAEVEGCLVSHRATSTSFRARCKRSEVGEVEWDG